MGKVHEKGLRVFISITSPGPPQHDTLPKKWPEIHPAPLETPNPQTIHQQSKNRPTAHSSLSVGFPKLYHASHVGQVEFAKAAT